MIISLAAKGALAYLFNEAVSHVGEHGIRQSVKDAFSFLKDVKHEAQDLLGIAPSHQEPPALVPLPVKKEIV